MRCDPETENGEFRAPKVANRPYMPTKAEIDAHYPLHAEYRSWCKYRVEGKGASRLRRTGYPTDETIGVTISIDYFFTTPEESEEGMDAMLAGYDEKKKIGGSQRPS